MELGPAVLVAASAAWGLRLLRTTDVFAVAGWALVNLLGLALGVLANPDLPYFGDDALRFLSRASEIRAGDWNLVDFVGSGHNLYSYLLAVTGWLTASGITMQNAVLVNIALLNLSVSPAVRLARILNIRSRLFIPVFLLSPPSLLVRLAPIREGLYILVLLVAVVVVLERQLTSRHRWGLRFLATFFVLASLHLAAAGAMIGAMSLHAGRYRITSVIRSVVAGLGATAATVGLGVGTQKIEAVTRVGPSGGSIFDTVSASLTVRNVGGTAYPAWALPSQAAEFFLLLPVLLFLFFSEPLITQPTALSFALALPDMVLLLVALRARLSGGEMGEAPRRVFFAAMVTAVVLAVGTSNGGTAMRHRQKVLFLLFASGAASATPE